MNIISYIGIGLGYIFIGVGWSFTRWKRYVDEEVNFYEQERQRFLNFHHIRGIDIPEFLVFDWRQYVQQNERLIDIPPKANDYQGVIAFDFILWWLSMILVGLQQVFSIIMQIVLVEYNKITERKIDRIEKDLKG